MPPIKAAISAFLTITLGFAAPAWTCSFVRLPDFQLANQTLPSNVSGGLYRHCSLPDEGQAPALSLRIADTDEEIDLHIEPHRELLYEVTFASPLNPQTSYVLRADGCEALSSGSSTWTFQTADEAPPPQSLGSWIPSAIAQGEVEIPADDACTTSAEAAFVDLHFEIAEDGEAWGRAIAFETYVNGQYWLPERGLGHPISPGASRLGWGLERVFVICDEQERPSDRPSAQTLTEGINRVELRAWLPGTDLIWTSESESFVLRCESEEDFDDEDPPDDPDLDEEPQDPTDDSQASGCSQTGQGPSSLFLFAAFILFVFLPSRTTSRR